MRTIGTRQLNRTLLRRQRLDRRVVASVEDVVGHLVAVQAQEPNWAIVGLQSRVEGLHRDDVGRLAEARTLVRSPLLRGTQHLVTASDYLWLRPTAHPLLERLVRAPYYAEQTVGLDPAELAAAALELLAGGDLVRRRTLGAALADRFGTQRRAAVLAAAVECHLPVVHSPATSSWGSWWSRRSIAVAHAPAWIGAPMAEPDVRRLVRRYLTAFGPAGVMDVQAWSGLTRLREVVDAMRDELRTLRGPDGTELFDLPDAPLADDDLPAPVRFLAAFDNAVLGHRDRSRILDDDLRRAVMPGYANVLPTVLVDGFVRATWEVTDGDVVVHPLRPLAPADADAVLAEGEQLLPFLDLRDGDVVLG